METNRLILSRFNDCDVDFLYKLNNNKDVNEFLSYDSMSIEKCIDSINTWSSKYGSEPVFGVYKILLKDDIHPIGLIFIVKREESQKLDLGYRILPAYWKKGYCKEAATALISKVFLETSEDEIYAGTHTDNMNSVHFLLKLGFDEITSEFNGSGRVFLLAKQKFCNI